ncbi:MAG: DUF6929 family protein, partial [Flavobacteriales bacterium]
MKSFATILFFVNLLLTGCNQQRTMEIKVIDRSYLTGIPSASGIELLNDHYYVIGDNSPFLFELGLNLQIEQRYQIASVDSLENDVIPKSRKKDLEAMCGFIDKVDTVILLLGSGSKSPIRDHAKLIRLKNGVHEIKEYDLFSFYLHAKEEAKLNDETFNLEAAAVLDDRLYLFNRGDNKIIECSLAKFMKYLNGEKDANDIKLKVTKADLPSIKGIEAGFSGAATDQENGRILFTASVENTDNWIDDGQVLGSFIGVIEPEAMSDHYKPLSAEITENGKVLPVKVESIAISSADAGSARCILVTDSDGGESE